MRVLFATAELAPIVKVGGLGDFSEGLTKMLRSAGVDVEVLLPDYGLSGFEETSRHELTVADWATPAFIRKGVAGGIEVSLVSVPLVARSNPYVDENGAAWSDNDRRFFAFSAAIAAWAGSTKPDVLHLNDWHTAMTLGFLGDPPPSVFTIHNLAYQGDADAAWLDLLPYHRDKFRHRGQTNPMAGGIALADRVVTVSSRFAEESLPPGEGFGLAALLDARGEDFLGILNGIDTRIWDPSSDPHLVEGYDAATVAVKEDLRRDLVQELGWTDGGEPLVGMVTRLTGQKGVDIALSALPVLEQFEARMVLLGSGDRDLVDLANRAQQDHPDRLRFRDGYDEVLSHRIFGASDLYLMPSRFEPAGLTQMQAMRYGSIPVVSDVGGLHDTVVDADEDPEHGTGFVAAAATTSAVVDAIGRAVKAWRQPERRRQIIERGMTRDWSWAGPGSRYVDLYKEITSAR